MRRGSAAASPRASRLSNTRSAPRRRVPGNYEHYRRRSCRTRADDGRCRRSLMRYRVDAVEAAWHRATHEDRIKFTALSHGPPTRESCTRPPARASSRVEVRGVPALALGHGGPHARYGALPRFFGGARGRIIRRTRARARLVHDVTRRVVRFAPHVTFVLTRSQAFGSNSAPKNGGPGTDSSVE